MPSRPVRRRNPPRAVAHDPAVGTEVELETTGVAHGGIMVARHEGRVVFVADAIPGERVRARVTEAKSSFWRADTLEVLEASPHRREHVWSEASVTRDPEGRAGGAEFGHIELAHQRELKRQVAADALARIGRIDDAPDFTVQALPGGDDAAGTGWRTRVTLHVAPDGTVGPYAARSHTVIPVSSLPLAVPELAAIAPLTERLGDAASVDLIAPAEGPLQIVTARDGSRPPLAAITERVGDREFALEALGFWQVHRLAAATLTGAVQRAIDADAFDPRAANLDLYGGVGLLAAAVGDRFGQATRITSVESYESATDFAARNLAEWVGARAVTGRVEQWVRGRAENATATERGRQRAATIVLDPPRAGAGTEVVAELVSTEPAQVVYVACDPVAFARDAKAFAAAGYAIRSLEAFDLFPNTHHVELVARLSRD
ncbi:class I SAM-dependent RNA methyltransferase [Gryllotalpicola reticulitermitis]|uniref:Class I SAM-dependent RNA methyltransferase n=1 Tax=Gryllotalpicola reticulitermitis TaxID=1184153 RepID=A0ABV8Q4Z4_9MICO